MYCTYTANLSLSVLCDITTEEKVPWYMLKLWVILKIFTATIGQNQMQDNDKQQH